MALNTRYITHCPFKLSKSAAWSFNVLLSVCMCEQQAHLSVCVCVCVWAALYSFLFARQWGRRVRTSVLVTSCLQAGISFTSRLCVCVCVCVCVCASLVLYISQSVVGWASSSLGAVHCAEPRQRDPSVGVDVAVGALVHPFHQVLLVQQRVVGAQRAGGVEETLVVMAELRLPAGRQELVDVHHLAQWHHQDGAWTGNRGDALKLLSGRTQ